MELFLYEETVVATDEWCMVSGEETGWAQQTHGGFLGGAVSFSVGITGLFMASRGAVLSGLTSHREGDHTLLAIKTAISEKVGKMWQSFTCRQRRC